MCGPFGNSFACTATALNPIAAARAMSFNFTVVSPSYIGSPVYGRMSASLTRPRRKSIGLSLVKQSLDMLETVFRQLQRNKPHHQANQHVNHPLRSRGT